MKNIIYLGGLPRSGSTLLCNLLAMHPEIDSTPSSPLADVVDAMRCSWSNSPFFLAQLDNNYNKMYNKLITSIRSFMNTWVSDCEKPNIVDKHRNWVACAQILKQLYPDFKMIVTIRDLRDIFASIELQHDKTLFINFPDNMEHHIVDARANSLFDLNGLIGRCITCLNNLGDIPDIMSHIFIWRYEDFIISPEDSMKKIFNWLGVEQYKFNFSDIKQSTVESDSFYRMKYPHKISQKLIMPKYSSFPILCQAFNISNTNTVVSPRILAHAYQKFSWYYKQFYPEFFVNEKGVIEQRTAEEIKTAIHGDLKSA